MDQDSNHTPPINFGIRYFAAALVVVHAVPSIIAFLGFGFIKAIFSEFLSGKPLPVLSRWVIGADQLSFVIPLIAVLVSVGFLITSKSRQMPYYVVAVCMVCLALHTLVIYVGLLLPLLQIIPALP